MERPADTTVFRLVHRAMVASAQRLAEASGRADHDAGALARWAGGFVAELRWHQADEDAATFPALLERVPAAASIVSRLTADHRELDGLLDQLDAALAGPAPAPGVGAVAGRLHDLLAAHAFDEDVYVAPLIERHLSFQEHQAQLVAAAGRLPLRQATWTVPWLRASCVGEEGAALDLVLTDRLRAIERLCAGRYRRLTAAAFAA